MKTNPINHIEFIAHEAVDSVLSAGFLRKTEKSASALAEYLGCNKIQAILFSIICNLNFSHRAVGINRIAEWLECTPITVARHMKELEDLRSRKILRKEAEDNCFDGKKADSIAAICYSVNPLVLEALTKGEPFSIPRIIIKDNFELIKAITGFIQQRDEGKITFEEMWHEIARIESENANMDFLKEVRRSGLEEKERILFYNLCDEYFFGNLNCDLIPMIRLVTPETREQLEIRYQINNGNSQLIAKGLVDLRDGYFRSEKEIVLTSKAIELLTGGETKMVMESKEKRSPDIVPFSEIGEKVLFFTPAEEEKHSFLRQLLMPGQYKGLVRRLGNSGMKTGIAILFHGPPGTGKTESVFQLARQTGRNIFQVSISETKSKWFGDSEKKIKEVFDRYRKICCSSDDIPILLFNEADGVFSTRKQVGNSSVDQTENAIQNIILQEMEELKGILIATTNLTQNFDKAFDRRFLYKIMFEKPSIEAKYNIWRDKIPDLTGAAALHFAESHDLSGGQIDNVARKYLMSRVLYGKRPVQKQIESWCREELQNGYGQTRIGYR